MLDALGYLYLAGGADRTAPGHLRRPCVTTIFCARVANIQLALDRIGEGRRSLAARDRFQPRPKCPAAS